MSNILENLQKQAGESQKRWDDIAELAEKLETAMKPHGSIEEVTKCSAKLLLLMVEQFKPMSTIESDGLMKEILGSLGGTKSAK